MAERARILIVDDEPFNVDLLEQELDLLEHDTIAASDGAAALQTLTRQPVDLVLLDIMMPELDGYEVLRRMKNDAELRRVPVIMISALSELDSVVRCIELGAEDYLPKPFNPLLLKARIGACLEKKRSHDREIAYRREIEHERADRLLHAILPAPAVRELEASDRIVPRRHDDVAVMFADIVDFTAYSETHAPEEVVEKPGLPRAHLRGPDGGARGLCSGDREQRHPPRAP
jgi:adenylate cyclase